MSRELKHETFADISEELRSISRSATYCEIDQPKVSGKPIAFYFAELADRIDAAELALSNAAAMHEALAGIRALIADEPDGTPMIDAMKATIDAALSAPARNCDRFETAEKAWDAYDEWVESYRLKGKVEPFNELGWLFAPAAEWKGEGDGR